MACWLAGALWREALGLLLDLPFIALGAVVLATLWRAGLMIKAVRKHFPDRDVPRGNFEGWDRVWWVWIEVESCGDGLRWVV